MNNLTPNLTGINQKSNTNGNNASGNAFKPYSSINQNDATSLSSTISTALSSAQPKHISPSSSTSTIVEIAYDNDNDNDNQTISSESTLAAPTPTRQIKIIRNETGYGFTLSRFIIYSNVSDNKPSTQVCFLFLFSFVQS